jgi:glycosyltransferase involved in cell wall biosynthesis
LSSSIGNSSTKDGVSRIAIVIEYPTVNGGENSMLAVLKYLLDRGMSEYGIDVCMLAPPEGPMAERVAELGIRSVDLTLFNADGMRLPRHEAISNLIQAAEKAGAQLVHGNSLAMGRLLGAAAEFTPPFVSTAHLRDIIRLSRAAITDLNANRKLVAVSEAALQFHVAQGLDENIGTVIHNGISEGRFVADASSRQSVRSKLGIAADAFVVLTVGQIGLRKGLDTLARAGGWLAKTRTGIHWLLAGDRFSQKSESVKYEADVMREFASYEPGLQLHRLGYRDDVPALMQAADILVHAARQEPLGRVLLEAAISGLAIVATDVGGTAEILSHRESALLVPVDSPEAIAEAVDELLDDANLRQQLANRARERIRSSFPVSMAAESLVEVWLSVLADSQQAQPVR